MIIVQCEEPLKPEKLNKLAEWLQRQAKSGIIVLPRFCKLLEITGGEKEKIKVVNPPTYSIRKDGVICSASEQPRCGYSRAEIKKLQDAGFKLYTGDVEIKL